MSDPTSLPVSNPTPNQTPTGTASPADTGSGDTGQVIAQDIAAADAVLTPLISSVNPVVGTGVHLGLKLLSVAEPAVYAAVVAVLQGNPLTPEQDAALKTAEGNLQTPEKYFA